MFPNLSYLHLDGDTLTYGNYGGLDYTAGVMNGTITGTSADPPPVDAYDKLFYQHDLALQQASTPEARFVADVQVVEGVSTLLSEAVSSTVSGWHLF